MYIVYWLRLWWGRDISETRLVDDQSQHTAPANQSEFGFHKAS